MKKYASSLAIIAAAALALVSCQKEIINNLPSEDGINVTITAGTPQTKTALGSDGETPYWKDGDALSVTNGTSSNVSFTENSIADGETALIATFSGKVSEAGDYYAVYPHTGSISEGKGPRVSVPAEQHPTATSFDGAADIMVSKKFSVGVTTNTTIENLQFARCGAIIKLIFSGKAAAQQSKLADQHPVSVSLTADSDLVGNVLFDYENGTASISSTASKTVSASYTNSTQYLIDGTNATYLVVVPTTLSGTLKVDATTEDYEISRNLTLADDIVLEAGKIYTFNVKLGDASIADAASVQALPWSNDFSWHTTTTESNYTTDVTTQSSGEFTGGSYIYGAKEVGAIRIGNGSNPGAITTKLMNLSGAFKVTVRAKAYNTGDGSKVTVTVGDVTKTADATLGSAYSDYVFNFDAGDGTAKSSLTIGTDQKRAVITSVSVESSIPQVATPTFSPVAGAVEKNTTVTISCTTEGATIYYTTDGTAPTTSSTSGTSVTIDAAKTIKAIAVKEGMANSAIATAEYTIAGAPVSLPYSNTLINGHSDFTFDVVSDGGLSAIWTDTQYGIQANGYQCTSNVEAYAVSPLIDLSSVAGAKATFTHGINYFADVATAKTQATLEVRVKNGTWTAIEIPTYPSSLGNSTADAEVDLSSYVGNIIQLRFKYLATTTKPGRWQIKNFTVEEVVPLTKSAVTFAQPSETGCSIAVAVGGNSISNGTLVEEGETVTLTADAGTGFKFDAWTVYKTGDENTKVTVSSNSFTMPAYPVTIVGEFSESQGDAEGIVYTLTPTNGSNNSYTGNCDVSVDGITWNLTGNSQINPWRIGGKSLNNTDRALYSKTALNKNVSKIEITHGAASSITVNSMTVIVSKNADFSSPVSTLTPNFAANGTVTVNRPDGKDWSNCYYKFIYNVTVSGSSNKFIEFTKAVFTGK